MNQPSGLALDGAGDLFIADGDDNVIREVVADGTIRTVAGVRGVNGSFAGDGGPALQAHLSGPYGLAVNAGGDLLIADGYNQRIRKVVGLAAAGLAAGAPFPSPAPPSGALRSDDFGSGLGSFWNATQPQGAATLPAPGFTVKEGTLSLTSADNDVWLGTWEPYFIYQDGITGDFSARVKVEATPACNELGAVGLMVASSVPDPYARPSDIPTWGLIQATHGYGPDTKWGGQGRSKTSLAGSTLRSMKAHYWLRLDRTAENLSFFVSPDGSNWSPVGATVDFGQEAAAPLGDPVSVGIVMQTHCGATEDTAVVSHFQATGSGGSGILASQETSASGSGGWSAAKGLTH